MLFTIGNPKTLKGEAQGWLTAVLHLSPASSSGIGNVCAMATPGCIATCLNTAGRGGIFRKGETTNAIQEARKRRTRAWFANREAFTDQLAQDIVRLEKRAAAQGLRLAVRVNGTSDLPMLAIALARRFPTVQFYDYTKMPVWRMGAYAWAPDNLHRTFSRSELNAQNVWTAMEHDMNIAVVFSTRRGQPLPATYLGRPVIDGDKHDLRFLDPINVVVGLRAKGRARKDRSGFVVAA